MKNAKEKDKRLFVARRMPPLRKRVPGGEYDPRNDEVLQWIAKQPGIMTWTFERLKNYGMIVYDGETGAWKGADYEA